MASLESLPARRWLTERLAAELDRDPAGLRPDVLLAEYGMDSIQAATLIADIEDAWGLALDPAVVWEHPTIAELAEVIVREHGHGHGGTGGHA